MAASKISALDIFKHTKRTNCGECQAASCMAFALLAAKGEKRLEDCPHLDPEATAELAASLSSGDAADGEGGLTLLDKLKEEIRGVDFAAAAPKLGAEVSGGRLVIRCLGKVFEIDKEGGLHSECHVNNWVHLPLMQYAVHGKGAEVTGVWKRFGELEGYTNWERFFTHRCEKTLHRLADEHTDLFFDILDLFGKAPDGDAPFTETRPWYTPCPRSAWPSATGPPKRIFKVSFRCSSTAPSKTTWGRKAPTSWRRG